uniref:uncharacterized protein LOC122604687 n=1 Tax=Erigeron canadensis TaxID=72917 RepID=UPI001CB8CF6B|nr:uncharacterized protein LOC122604687 [Erigeron canadensis]
MNVVKLETFPITLTGDAEDWFNDLPENSITTWDQLKEAFIGEFYSVRTQRQLENLIRSFVQEDGEDVVDAWIQFKEMLRNCPGHELTKEKNVELFFDGLNKGSKREMEYAFGGSFSKITPNEGYDILERMVKDNAAMDDKSFLENEGRFKESKVARADVSNSSNVIDEIQALSARMDKGFANQESRFGYLERDVKVLDDGCDHCGETHYSEECSNRGPEDPQQQETQQSHGSGSSSSTTDPNAELREMMKQMMSNQMETNTSIQNIREDTRQLSERLDRINGKVEMNAKNQDINFKDLESRMATITRPQGALPSNTQQNPKQNQGSNNGQKYTPPPVRQEQAKAITTRTVGLIQGMPNYAKFIKELVTDKARMDEVNVAYLNAECSAILQNQQIPPKLEDLGSFLITCSIRTLTCKALADLGASINLMPYSVWNKEISLGVGTDRIVFNVERIDVVDDALDQEFEALMETEVDEELTCLGASDIDDDELFKCGVKRIEDAIGVDKRKQFEEGQGSGSAQKQAKATREAFEAPTLKFWPEQLNEKHPWLEFSRVKQPQKNNFLNELYSIHKEVVCPPRYFAPTAAQHFGIQADINGWFRIEA